MSIELTFGLFVRSATSEGSSITQPVIQLIDKAINRDVVSPYQHFKDDFFEILDDSSIVLEKSKQLWVCEVLGFLFFADSYDGKKSESEFLYGGHDTLSSELDTEGLSGYSRLQGEFSGYTGSGYDKLLDAFYCLDNQADIRAYLMDEGEHAQYYRSIDGVTKMQEGEAYYPDSETANEPGYLWWRQGLPEAVDITFEE